MHFDIACEIEASLDGRQNFGSDDDAAHVKLYFT